MALRYVLITALLVGVTGPGGAGALPPGNAERGKQLHAAQCTACHDSRVYTRENRIVKSHGGLIHQVEQCHQQLGNKLTREHVSDLIAYLNETYYRFE